jgi:hypothetical protein
VGSCLSSAVFFPEKVTASRVNVKTLKGIEKQPFGKWGLRMVPKAERGKPLLRVLAFPDLYPKEKKD